MHGLGGAAVEEDTTTGAYDNNAGTADAQYDHDNGLAQNNEGVMLMLSGLESYPRHFNNELTVKVSRFIQ